MSAGVVGTGRVAKRDADATWVTEPLFVLQITSGLWVCEACVVAAHMAHALLASPLCNPCMQSVNVYAVNHRSACIFNQWY